MKTDKVDFVSVIVMVKDPQIPTLEYCLKSIFNSEGKKEVIIVTPHPDSLSYLTKKFKELKLVKDPGCGIGIARNIGITVAKSEYVCFVDPDAIVGRKHFKQIMEIFNSDDRIGLIDVHTLMDVEKMELFGKLQRLELLLWKKGRFMQKVKEKDIIFVGGTFMALRKSAWKKVKGFWEWPPYGADDLDFSFRVFKAGYKVARVFVEGSFHFPRYSLIELFKEQYGWGKGYAYLWLKYRSEPMYWRRMEYEQIFYKSFPENFYCLIPVIRFLLAPLGGLIHALKFREISLLPYWTFRRYAFLLGFLTGLMSWKNKKKK
ncbi:MAG: glycosyltransferase family 2 protein [Conexivisphaerales archaeon]